MQEGILNDLLDDSISSIRAPSDENLQPIIKKYWSLYGRSHPPSQLDVNGSLNVANAVGSSTACDFEDGNSKTLLQVAEHNNR